ncbi:MAG: InlB B-repeat-containing protein [Spirochaetaceae bacterium]|nr:InlB B-repeat-containing protein [Spirochaetaceae bacterium]
MTFFVWPRALVAAVLLALCFSCINPQTTPDGVEIPADNSGMVQVVFDPNGGEWSGVSQWEIVSATPKGGPFAFPSKPPLLKGFSLAGWYTSARPPLTPGEKTPQEGRITSGTLTERDMRLFALWRENPPNAFAVTFKQHDGDTAPVVELALRENDYKIPAENIPRLYSPREFHEPQTETGLWWTEAQAGERFTAETVLETSITVFMHWEGKKWKIFFDTNGGAWPFGADVAGFAYFPAEDSEAGELPYYVVQYPSRTIAASERAMPAVIPHKNESAESGGTPAKPLTFLSWVVMPTDAHKDDYAEVPDDAPLPPYSVFGPHTTISGDITLTALWQRAPEDAQLVVFNLVEGQAETKYAYANDDGKYYVPAASFPNTENPEEPAYHSLPGYTFTGWYTQADGGGTAFSGASGIAQDEKNPAGDVYFNVYARWAANEYKVQYELNYGEAGEYTGVLNAPGFVTVPETAVTLPVPPVRAGWSFVRWMTGASGGDMFTGAHVSANTKVYALWALLPALESNSAAADGGSVQSFTVPENGWYRVELWGAQGGDVEILNGKGYGGRGAYTKGNIFLFANEKLFLYTGGARSGAANGGFNGGGRGLAQNAGGGGGATDVRTVNSADAVGLASRIMVAGGGGGGCDARWSTTSGATGPNKRFNGGSGGVLSGFNGEGLDFGRGGQQRNGGSAGLNGGAGSFGYGGSPRVGLNEVEVVGGGGGGWFGGGSGGQSGNNGGGGGGSSYISGYPGCIATKIPGGFSEKDGAENSVSKATSWTNKVFTHMVIKSGIESMPSPLGGVETGHSGPGFGRITFVGMINDGG